MDYKDLNAIGIVRLMLTDGVISVEQAANYFPELRDEEVRKAIIQFFELQDDNTTYSFIPKKDIIAWLEKQGENTSLPKFTFDDVLALQFAMVAAKNLQKDKDLYEQLESLHDRVHDAYWLEKKGEQKPIDIVAILKDYFANTPKEQREKDWAELKHLNDIGFDAEIAFGAKDSELQEETYFIPNGFHAEIDGNKVVIKKGEKNPAWSEDDEEIHRKCICAMRASACGFPEEEKFVEQVDNWLKSLKDRVGCEANCTTTKEWSDEDEKRISSIQLSIQYCREQYADLRDYQSDVNWLNELKNRVQS